MADELISHEAFKEALLVGAEYLDEDTLMTVINTLDCFPSVDAVEVVRCKDCRNGRTINKLKSPERYYRDDCIVCECERVVGDEPMIYEPMHFCSYGERKEDNANS